MQNVMTIVVLVGLVVLFGWLALRARRSGNKAVKWVGTPLAGLLALLLLVVVVAGSIGLYGVYRTYDHPVADVQVAASPEVIATGERWAQMCVDCHAADGQLPLEGMDLLADAEGAPPVGSVWAPNLTPAHLADWTDGEIIRAIREGVGKDGRSLVIMPSQGFHGMSDADVQALVAYLRSQPAVEPDTPAANLNFVGALFTLLEPTLLTVQAPIAGPVVAPPKGATAEYGAYFVSATGCEDCHGKGLAGSEMGPDLRVGATKWTDEEFVHFFRTGERPGATAVDPVEMPWPSYSKVADDDTLRALHAYILTLGSPSTSSE